MRRFAMVAGVIFALPGAAHAQSSGATNAYQYSLQFAVPASPAFKLVDVQESAVLRPTSFHQLSSTLGEWGAHDGNLHVPKEVGFELAPFFLARARTLSLSQYRANPGLYRFRVSGAYRRGEGIERPTVMAFGVRFAPYDKSDPRTSEGFVNRVTELDARIARICARQAVTPPSDEAPGVVSCADPRGFEARLSSQIAALPDTAATRAGLERSLAAFQRSKAAAQAEIDAINGEITKLKSAWTDSAWNKSGFEFAFAGSAQSRDTLGRNPQFRSAAAWMSGAAQLGGWGQLVGGGNVIAGRDSVSTDVRTTGSGGIALYIGGDRYKGFMESQFSVKSETKHLGATAKGGAEVFLAPGLWAHASAGWELDPDTRRGRIVSQVTLRTKFPFTTPSAASP